MNTFLWVMAIMFAIQVIGKLSYILADDIPVRTVGDIAVDAVFCVAYMCWAIALLVTQ